MKRCSKCKEEKQTSEFHKNRTRKDGLQYRCKACLRAYQNSSRRREWMRERYHSKQKNDPVYRENRRIYNKRCREKVRREAYDHYGKECVVCGYDEDIRALTIDHIDEDGAEHRRNAGGTGDIHSWLKVNNYPPNFQVLCRNCNWIKHCDYKEARHAE